MRCPQVLDIGNAMLLVLLIISTVMESSSKRKVQINIIKRGRIQNIEETKQHVSLSKTCEDYVLMIKAKIDSDKQTNIIKINNFKSKMQVFLSQKLMQCRE